MEHQGRAVSTGPTSTLASAAKTPFAVDKIHQWVEDERALVERHAGDGRNFVKKAVNWALRQMGKRSPALMKPALALAEKLAASEDRTARWIGRDAAKELSARQAAGR